MNQEFDPALNYEQTKQEIGYVDRNLATQADYDRIGFMAGLEVHQQLNTSRKLFCNCPAGLYHKNEEFDAEIIRHMRPTLSELGEYDGTALMEFKTRKNIIYRIKNETACTYEVDDTPPFPINKEALEIAIEISLLSKLNIVGEVHITRKQYLDGSIPTGFQRTAIIGVEGEIQLKNKKIRLIQLSIEEDSCREISDIGHWRIYKTDRLGMPLIETVTYPDFKNPDEVKEGADYIRFLNRSTGKVRTGAGSTRADTNVSCAGGTRVELKGVPNTHRMLELTHNEAFRQWALLAIRTTLRKKFADYKDWKVKAEYLNVADFKFAYQPLVEAKEKGYKMVAILMPGFKGILSHFTQPGKIFANEISDRLKVIACLEKPNMIHSERFEKVMLDINVQKIVNLLECGNDDAWLLLWGPEEDMKTAIETVEERCKMAFEGVPNETRKSFIDGTTIFERVLPGADRMYPDTDSKPIPLPNSQIERLKLNLPPDISARYEQLKSWGVPDDTYTYLLKRNHLPMMEKINNELGISYRFSGSFLGHTLKHIENHFEGSSEFRYDLIFDLFKFLKQNNLELVLAKKMLAELYQHPKLDFESVLTYIHFKRTGKEEVVSKLPFLKEKFSQIRQKDGQEIETKWIMGQISPVALGNVNLSEIRTLINN